MIMGNRACVLRCAAGCSRTVMVGPTSMICPDLSEKRREKVTSAVVREREVRNAESKVKVVKPCPPGTGGEVRPGPEEWVICTRAVVVGSPK